MFRRPFARFAALAVLLSVPAVSAARAEPVLPDPGIGLEVERAGNRFVIRDVRLLAHPPRAPASEAPPPADPTPAVGADPDLSGLDPVASDRIAVQVPVGQAVVTRWDAATGALEVIPPDGRHALGAAALEAVAAAPAWIRDDLASNLSLLAPPVQDAIAAAVTGVADPAWLDEVAFLAAGTPAEDLSAEGFRPASLADQARLAYAADPLLDFVRIVERSDPVTGEAWTTAAYRSRAGEGGLEEEWELPRSDWYWWVIHPRLDGEPLADVDPSTGKAAAYPDGLGFREYFLDPPHPVDSVRSYTRHYVFRKPPNYEAAPGLKDVPYGSVPGWGPSQVGALEWPDKGPLEITRDSKGRPTTIEFKRRPKGIVLATTLRVEAAYAEGRSNLLENMLRYGAGNVILPKSAKTCVVMVRPPYGHAGVVEGVLDAFGAKYEVVGPEWLAAGDLSEAAKIVVPSDQPLDLYLAVSDNRARIEEWLGGPAWRVLEFHGAASPDGDWSGLPMPGGFTGAGVADEPDDVVEVEGQPPLARVLPGTALYWDGVKRACLSGDRPLAPSMFAIDKVGWWASQNLFDSVVDWGEKHYWIPAPERTSWAQRLLYNHFGNCGEEQDMVTSTAKTMLIPAANTSDSCEDHVWTEFLHRDSWHPIGLGWSDGDACIDDAGIASGKKHGGGKNVSFVVKDRGDGARINRTDLYENTGTLKVTVTDADDRPVAAATVLFVTESFYAEGGKFPLTIAHWDVTGDDGSVTVHPGANGVDPISDCADPVKNLELRCNSYSIRVLTPFGTFPAAKGEVWLAVPATEAGPGFSKAVTVKVEGRAAVRLPDPVANQSPPDATRAVTIDLDAATRMSCGRSLTAERWCESAGPGDADVMVLDQAGYEAFAAGKAFEAIRAATGAGPGSRVAAHPPASGDVWVAVVNRSPSARELLLDLRVGRLAAPPAPALDPGPEAVPDSAGEPAPEEAPEPGPDAATEDTGAQDAAGPAVDPGATAGGDSSGGCGAGAPAAGGPIVLLLATALAACRTRRASAPREGARPPPAPPRGRA
ncbi:MAG: hypothetical protein FJ087_06750 [Deltaproteobacteria bacterium]|nr:hypothetical protein [Deltaproteobacteria bacterium]